MSSAVDSFLARVPAPVAELIAPVRQLILEAVPDVEEEIKWGFPCYSKNGLLCFIGAAKTYITFGFYRGDQLSDPEKLLLGEGKRMRHIKIESRNDIRPEIFRSYIEQALRLNETP